MCRRSSTGVLQSNMRSNSRSLNRPGRSRQARLSHLPICRSFSTYAETKKFSCVRLKFCIIQITPVSVNSSKLTHGGPCYVAAPPCRAGRSAAKILYCGEPIKYDRQCFVPVLLRPARMRELRSKNALQTALNPCQLTYPIEIV